MRRRRSSLSFLLVPVFLLVGCAPTSSSTPVFPSGQNRAELQLDLSDDNRTIGVAVGALFTVTLPEGEGAGGGVQWRITAAPDPDIVRIRPARSMGGGPGVEPGGQDLWTFQGAGPGTTTLEMTNGAQTFRLIISVT